MLEDRSSESREFPPLLRWCFRCLLAVVLAMSLLSALHQDLLEAVRQLGATAFVGYLILNEALMSQAMNLETDSWRGRYPELLILGFALFGASFAFA